MNYQDINAEAVDRWAENGWEWGQPIGHEEYAAAKLSWDSNKSALYELSCRLRDGRARTD